MSICRIKRNVEGQIEKVFDINGVESVLFKDIASNPFISTTKDALDIYKTAVKYSDSIVDEFESPELAGFNVEEPKLIYQTDGEVNFTSYKQALQNSVEGQVITMGVIEDGVINPIVEIPYNVNPNTQQGFINHGILSGLVSDTKEKVDNEYWLTGAGHLVSTKVITKELLEIEARKMIGKSGIERKDNYYFKFTTPRNFVKTIDKKGNEKSVPREEIEGKTFKELDKKYDNAFDLVISEEIKNSSMMRAKSEYAEKDTSLTEKDLRTRLLNFLNEIGVKTISLDNYKLKYKLKNGVEPSATALADITNSVIAYSKGEITTEELTEETAHFIVEGWNQEEITDLLRNIEKTPEWTKYNSEYRSIYSKEYSGDELDDVVRREVLGKILAASLQNNFSKENETTSKGYIIDFIKDLFNKTIEAIKGIWNQSYQDKLDSFTNQVAVLMNKENLASEIDTKNFADSRFTLYSTASKNIDKVTLIATKALNALENQTREFKKANKGLATDSAKQKLYKSNLEFDKTKDVETVQRLSEEFEEVGGDTVSLEELKQVSEHIDKQMKLQAITGMISLSQRQIKYLENALLENAKGDRQHFFSIEENNVYTTLKSQLRPALIELKTVLKDEYKGQKHWDIVVKELEVTLTSVDNLEGSVGRNDSKAVDRLVAQAMVRHNFGEDYRTKVTEWVESAHKDTNFLHFQFGQLIHARDPILNLLGAVIETTMGEARNNFLTNIKIFNKRINNIEGFKFSDLPKLIVDGNFLVSATNHKKYEDDKAKAYAESFIEIIGKSDTSNNELKKLTEAEIIEFYKKRDIPTISTEDATEIDYEVNKKMDFQKEKPFKTEYYTDRIAKYEELGIEAETISYMSKLSVNRNILTKKAIQKNGKVDFSKLSDSDKDLLDESVKERARTKSLVDSDGELKTGIELITDMTDLQKQMMEKSIETNELLDSNHLKVGDELYTFNLSYKEAVLSLDLYKIDMSFQTEQVKKDKEEGKVTKDIPEEFLTSLLEEETNNRNNAFEYLTMNARIDMSESYWDSILKDNKGYKQRLLEVSEKNPELRIEIASLVGRLSAERNKVKGILKQSKQRNNPIEVDADAISLSSKQAIRTASEELQRIYLQANSILKINEEVVGGEEVEVPSLSENNVNEAYLKEIAELGDESTIFDEIDFILEHVTTTDKARIMELKELVEQQEKGLSPYTPKHIEKIFDNYSTDESDLTTLQNYARAKLLPYFKRNAPIGYNTLRQDLQKSPDAAGAMSPSEFVRKVQNNEIDYLKITPHYTFYEQEENSQINPNYVAEYEGGYEQPNQDEYKDDRFFKLFQPVKVDGEWRATINKPLFEGRAALLELQRGSLTAVGELGRHNLYKLPQISKGTFEKAENLFKKGDTKEKLGEIFKDFAMYRNDDQEYGAYSGAGVAHQIIPKYFLRPLENQIDVSTELLYSYTHMAQQAYLHQARKNSISDVLALQDVVTSNSYKGKEAENSNTVRMFKSYMDYNYFGKKETAKFEVNVFGKKVDLTKMIRMMHGWVRLRNLGFAPIIAGTSHLTAEVNYQMEQVIGEYVHHRSSWLATKEFGRLAGAAMKEMGSLTSTAKMNVMGEWLGAYDITDRVSNSSYNIAFRGLAKTPMALHSMANFPVIPRIMLSALYDYRVMDGKIMNYNQYKNIYKNVPNIDMEGKWRQAESKNMYTFVNDNGLGFDTEKLAQEITPDEGFTNEEYINEMYLGIKSNISQVSQAIDGSMPVEQKTNAHRHFIMSYFLTHRNWLGIAIQRRLKDKHYSLASGEAEGGHYRLPFDFMGNIITEIRKQGAGKTLQIFKESWMNGDLTQKRAIKRVGIEFAFLNMVALLGFMIAGLADDDDEKDNDLLQVVNYISYRIMNETASTQGIGIGNEMRAVMDSPFVGMSVIEDLFSVKKYFSGEEIKTGRFRGMTIGQRQLIRTVPGVKKIYDVRNPRDAANSYYFYNENQLRSSIAGSMLFPLNKD